MSSGDEDEAGDVGESDWRAMRARLIARSKEDSTLGTVTDDRDGDASPSSSSYVYETPLIEQGTILLGGTKMDFGFALRQQFFHKSVMLLLQHDDTFTKGIILNRPSALFLDGWRAWCGHGQVAEGGLFVGAERMMGALEVNALHALTSPEADAVSTRVIKGVSYTSLEGARALVTSGAARREDFWMCVGYSGWAPGQLQMEVEQRDSWYLASADGGTLLRELLREARELPPPGADTHDHITVDPGLDTWSNLMRGIGREQDAPTERTLADRMLEEWVRVHLLPKPTPLPTTVTSTTPDVRVGTVFATTVNPLTNRPADRFLLDEQYLHKALLLVLDVSGPDGKISCCILNRPTASLFHFSNLPADGPANPRRRVPFTGPDLLGSELWLHHHPQVGGGAVGDSGIGVSTTDVVARSLEAGKATASDFLLVRGVVRFSRSELAALSAAGELCRLRNGAELSALWPRVWALGDHHDDDDVGDGTAVWWLASQQCGDGEGGSPSVPSDLADEALEEWLKFFARPKV